MDSGTKKSPFVERRKKVNSQLGSGKKKYTQETVGKLQLTDVYMNY